MIRTIVLAFTLATGVMLMIDANIHGLESILGAAFLGVFIGILRAAE